MAGRLPRDRIHYGVAAVLFGVIAVAGAVTVAKRGAKGEGAFVRFMTQTEGLFEARDVYRVSTSPTGLDEGYPHTPMMALVLRPFQALGAPAGAAAWALVKAALFLLVAVGVLRRWPVPAWGVPLLVLLSAQVIHLDLTHSNTNLLIAALVGGALLATSAGRDAAAGLLLGLGAALKVTPLLFLPYFLWKRRWKAAGFMVLGVLLFVFVVPGLVLGIDTNAHLLHDWSEQMLSPFLSGAPPNYMKTGHMNQSFTGVAYRLLGDHLAVWPQPRKDRPEMRVNVVSLDDRVVAWIVRGLSLVVIGVIAFACRGRSALGAFAAVALAMLFLSERSWREHYVLIFLAHVYLLRAAVRGSKLAVVALAASLLTHHGAYDELFGDAVSLRLQSYGIFLFGGLVLFAATCGYLARRGSR